MGRSALRIEVDSAREKISTFIYFLDSLDLTPGDLPQGDIKALADADTWLKKYSETLNNPKYINPRHLEIAEDYIKKLDEITAATKESIMNHVLNNFAVPREDQFKNYNAYAKAGRAWHRYEEFAKKYRLERFSLERTQALIDRANNPSLLVPVFLSFLGNVTVEKFSAMHDALYIMGELITHTPRSDLSSKTPYQKTVEDCDKYINSLKEERGKPSFSSYDFNGLFDKLGSRDAQERKDGEKLLNHLWEDYVDEKHGRSGVSDNRHHKNIIALWDEMRRRFDGAESADEKVLALKPFRKLWCSFIPSRFYSEVKEIILRGIVDDSGTVRYRIVRIIESISFEIHEHDPNNFNDLLNAVRDKREVYMRENKLTASRRARPQNIKDATLRSLTQGLEFLEYCAERQKVIGRIFL